VVMGAGGGKGRIKDGLEDYRNFSFCVNPE